MNIRKMTTGDKKLQCGFTLIELMVVIAIVAVLVTVAYPSYTDYITRSKRATAKSFLVRLADQQEHFFLDNKRYAIDLNELGYGNAFITIDRQGNSIPALAADRIYAAGVINVTATSYLALAVPQLGQAINDTECANMMLDQAGFRSNSGAGTDCWK